MLLSKLVACKASCSVQIVAMSATMMGLDSLSSWLRAHLFLTNFRPVPLTEHAVFGGAVYKLNKASGEQAAAAAAAEDGQCSGGSSIDSRSSTALCICSRNQAVGWLLAAGPQSLVHHCARSILLAHSPPSVDCNVTDAVQRLTFPHIAACRRRVRHYRLATG
jgi:superfamily II RNA helicase